MIIKKYTGKNEEEATEAARGGLGPGIVIMNVRQVKKTGFFAFLKPSQTEVTVALEEGDLPGRQSSVIRPEDTDATGKQGTAMKKSSFSAYVSDESGTASRTTSGTGEQLARAVSEGRIPPLRVAQTEGEIDSKLDDLQALLHVATVRKNGQKQNDPQASPNGIERDSEREETDAMVASESGAVYGSVREASLRMQNASVSKEESAKTLADFSRAHQRSDLPEENLSFIKLLYNTLLENDVNERYANELTDEVEKISKPDMPLEYALANVYQKMVLKFGPTEIIEPCADGPKAEIFIGPTGVGKTTTIAKLASRLYVAEHRKVALLTVDTYRIAAAEQLRTYASILEIPFRVIYSIEDMKQAAEDFKDYDFLMVDTAGHSLHNEEQKTNIVNFIKTLQEAMESESFLVLSATTKYRDLIEITDTYKTMVGDYKLIFTKMDETAVTGNLYNIRMHTGASMSYITNGQDVPDDIAVFNAQKIVKVLLGGSTRAE